MSVKIVKDAPRFVKPILSIDRGEARRRVLSLYKNWYRQLPYVVLEYDIPKSVEQCREKLRHEFRKNQNVDDIRVIDILVIKIPNVNKLLTKRGLGLLRFGPMADGVYQMGEGVQIGLNTVERRGDCSITDFGNSSTYYDYNLGFRLFMLGYGEFSLGGPKQAGLFKVNKNGIHLSFWVHKGTECEVELDKYELTLLDDAVLFSSVPEMDEKDVSQLFREYGKAKINQNMLGQRPGLQRALGMQICRQKKSSIHAALTNISPIASIV